MNLLEGLSGIFDGFGLNSPEAKTEKKWFDFSFLEDEEEKSAFETAKKEAESDEGLQLDEGVSSSHSGPLDTAKVKYGLNQTGYYDGDASTIPDQKMIDGVKAFQKDNNLQVDGLLRPKGETITTLNNKLKDFQATKKYESGTDKGEKEYIRWQLKQNEKEKAEALAPKTPAKPKKEESSRFGLEPLGKKKKDDWSFEPKSLIGEPKRQSLLESSEPIKTPAEQVRDEKVKEQKSINLLEKLQKKTAEDAPKQEYSWLNDKAEKQTNFAESDDTYGIKSADKVRKSKETSHSLLGFDINRNERDNKTIRNLLETKTKIDYPKPEDIKNEKKIDYSKYGPGFTKEFIDEMENDKRFRRAMDRYVDVHEGGYVNIKEDRGKETRYGITKKWYPKEDIKNITKERASAILYRDYWNYGKINTLPDDLVDIVFDNAVVQGQPTAIEHLHDALGLPKGGTIIGEESRKKLEELEHSLIKKRFIQNVQNREDDIIKNDPTQKKFKKGWRNRSNDY